MAAPLLDITKPAAANAWDTDLTAIRDTFAALMDAAASANYALPQWATVATGAPEYSSIEMTKGTLKMRWNFTWSSGLVTQEVRQYDRGLGAGYETLTGGTFAYTYDGSSNWTGTTTS